MRFRIGEAAAWARRDPTWIAQRFRERFVQRALESDRDPASVAAAFEAAYEEVQDRHPWAASVASDAYVTEMVDDNHDFAVSMSLKGLDVQRPAVLEHAETIRSIVRREVGDTFAPALEALRVLHYTAQECCEQFHSARAEGTARYEALTRLTARGLLVADEIQHLLAGGYPSGALGRWRSLHEGSVIAIIIAENDEKTAQRYLEHEIVDRARAAVIYKEHADAIGERPLDDDELERILRRRDEAVAYYGETFKGDYGWAADIIRGPHLRKLEAEAGLDSLRPYYLHANHPIHAGSRNLLNEIGSDLTDSLLAGPSSKGLTDPIQLTALTLTRLVQTLLYSGPDQDDDLQWVLQVEALDNLCERVIEALPKGDQLSETQSTEPEKQQEPQNAEPMPSVLTWPPVSWPEVRRGMWKQRLRTHWQMPKIGKPREVPQRSVRGGSDREEL